MKRRTRDWKRIEWLDCFLTITKEEIRLQSKREGFEIPSRDLAEISCALTNVLAELLADGWGVGPNGGKTAALSLLGENLGFSRKTVNRYARFAARLGLIMCVTERKQGGKYCPVEVLINPAFQTVFEKLIPKPRMIRVAQMFASIFIQRREFIDDVQGFESNCPWGVLEEQSKQGVEEKVASEEIREEERPIENGKTMREKILDAAAGVGDNPKLKKQREDVEWLAAREKFVAGCATVWVRMQTKVGMGHELPAWAGEKATIPVAQRRERVELEKVFGTYGGRKAALAWVMFCGGREKRDDKGKLVFDPSLAYKQWTTPDKKPSHFAKHINLVIADVRKHKWDEDSEMVERLRSVYNGSFDMPARDLLRVVPYAGGTDGNQAAAST